MSQTHHEATKIRCDHPGCTASIVYIPRRDGMKESITQGWTFGAGGEDFCVTHKPKPTHPTPWHTYPGDAGHSVGIIDGWGVQIGTVEAAVAQRIVDAVNKAATT